MTLGTGAGAARDVAVGATREQAAETFGEYFDDAFFTSYDDFDAEVDLSLLRSLGLVGGDGLSAVLPRVLASHNATDPVTPVVLVGLTPDMPRRAVVEGLLAEHPSVSFSQVLEAGESVLLPIEQAGRADPDDRRAALDLLPATEHRTASSDTAAQAPTTAPETSHGEPGSPPSPTGSRRGILALGLATAIVVIVAVLTTIGLALGADALLVTVVLALAVSQGVMLIGLVYAVRLVREIRQEVDHDVMFRKQMRRRTNKLIRLSEEAVRLQKEDLVAGQKARNEVAVVRKRVMALGELLSRSAATGRESPPRD